MQTMPLTSLFDDANKKAETYVSAYNAGGKKRSELQALKKTAMTAMESYNALLSKTTYKQWAAEGNPVQTALRMLYVPNAKKLKFTVSDENVMSFSVEPTNYKVDLTVMHQVLGPEVFNDAGWYKKAQAMAYSVAMGLKERFGDPVSFKYEVDQIAKEFEFDGIDPLSNDGAVIILQQTFDSILFIDDPENPGKNLIRTTLKKDKRGEYYSTEWQTIRESVTGAAGDNTVMIKNITNFVSLIATAMSGIINGKDFMLIAESPTTKNESEKEDDKKTDSTDDAK